jgi:hypothetical protein
LKEPGSEGGSLSLATCGQLRLVAVTVAEAFISANSPANVEDCGFATFASSKEIYAGMVSAKLLALAEGARIASSELWGR